MKYWESYKQERIDLITNDQDNRVLTIKHLGNDLFRFREECDAYFSTELSSQEAIAALEEAIEFIRGKG